MADKLKKNQRILNSDWDDDTLAYRESLLERSRKEEEEARRLEEARKKANFDNVDSGVTVGMSLDSYGRPQGTELIEPKPEAPNTDDGYSIWDVGVMARQGASSLTKGIAGLPVNLGNAVSAGPRFLAELATGKELEMQQPEFVKNLRSEIDLISENIYEQQASDKLKTKDQEFQRADGLWDTTKFLAKNPGYFGLQGAQQAPQLLGSGGAPGVIGKVVAGGLSAAGQVEDQTTKALREQGFSEAEIADRAAGAFGASFILNTATPFAAKSTFLEGVLSRAARGRVTDGVIKNVLATTNREVIEGVVTETGDQLIQNLASGKPWDENLAQSATLGAAFSAAVAGPAASIESAAEAGRAAARLQEYLSNQGYNKEANDIAKATKKPIFREPVQEDMFGGRGEIPIMEEGRTASDVGTDTDGVQARLRTQAATVRAQLEADRERLAGFQTRIERAPFAEDQADLLTNQERTDMSRIQERVAGQEKLLAELEAQQTPTQPGLSLKDKNQPKNPKFTGQERSVDQIKSDYFRTQPVQGPQNMTTAQRKAVQKDILEETKRTKAEQKKAADKVKAARAASRRKFLDGQRAGLLDLPVEERAKRLAEAGREWDTANPLVLPTQATQAAAPVEAEASVPVSTLTEGLQGTPQGTVPLPSTAQAPAQGTTLEDVRKAVGGGKRDKLASRLSYMVEDGNLEIVESQDQIPGDIGEMTVQGKGWFDPNTGKTYLVASNLDSNNTRGDILATLAHETKHAGDFGGSKGLAGSFKPFIGSKANSEMVEKIKKGAAAGDTSAQYAMKAVGGGDYQSLDLTQDQANSELVANYLTAEHKRSGVKTSLYRGIVSPLRVGAKKLLRSDDVSLEDIHYMADRLVNEVAQRGERMKPSNGNALPMTISGGRTEAEQIRNNRTWLSADKKRKYEISDKDSSVEIPGDYMDRDFKAKEILKHDKLYNELPELADTIIRFAELDPTVGGQYSREDDVITINTATNEFKRGRNMYNGPIHQYILHEMQHRAQGVSGTTPGASPTFFLPNEAKKLENDIEDLAFAINYGKSTGADADFLARQSQEMSQKEQEYLQKYGPNTPAYEAATIQYEKVLGELEAYRTNNNLTKTEAELDETGLGQQEVQWDKEEGITTETGKRIRPTTRPRQKAAAMPSVAEDYVPRELPVARTITRTAKLKDGTETKSKPMPSVAEQSEKDNRSWWNKKKDSSAAIRVVDDLLSTTEGLGTDLFKLFDARQGLRGDLSLRAEAVGSSAEQSLRNAAKNSGRTLKQISTEVEGKLEAINKLSSRSEREAAVKALDKTYPGLGTALTDLRNLKWSLSRAIIEQRAKQGTDLTPKETAIYGAILQNAETYTTRAYMSNQIPGKKFAKRRLENIKNAPDSEEATKFNEALQFLMDKHLVIPTNQELNAMEGKDIRKLYEQWIGDSSGVEVGTMAEKLNAIPRKTQEEYRAKAEIIAKELMGATKARSLTARGYGGARQNRTILEGRENVPQEIRFLMGEITNPVAAEMMSVARLVNLYSQTKMLQDMADKGKDNWYKDHNEGDFNTLLKDDAYGPMKGKWVSPTASKFLEPAVNVGMDLEQALSTSGKDLGRIAGMVAAASVDVLRKGTSLVKLADLVTSPAAMAWNYIGAYGIAAQNGVINPAKWAHAQKMTANAIGAHYKPNAFKGEDQKAIQELIRSRVLDSATVGEFQQSFYDNMFRLLEDEQGGQGKWDKVKRAISDGTMVAKDAYAFMDMWAKVAAYYDRKEYLTKFYEANGDKVDSEAIIREAGFDITAANISYTRALKAVKIAERNIPMFTMYLTYFSEVPRSLVSSAFLAAADFKRAKNAKTPKAAALAAGAGMARAAGTLAMTAGLTSLINMYLSGLDKDEERRRKTDPEWEQKGMPIPIGKTKDGKLVTTNILRADPNGPMTEFMVHMSNLGKNEDVGDALIKTVKNQFVVAKPIMQTFRLLKGLAGQKTQNYEENYGPLADKLDEYSWGKDENLGRNLMSVLEGFTPKVVKGTYRSLNGTIGKRKYEFDPEKELDVAAMQGAGINPSVRDPEFSLEMATSKYKKQKKEASEELNGMKSKLGRMDGKSLIDSLSDVVEDERKAYQALYDVYDGTKAFNGYYTDKDYAKAANGILKEAKIGPAGSDVANGAFNVRFISKDYINAWRDARIEKIKEMEPNKKSKAMAQLRQDYKMVADYLGTRE